MPRKARGAVSQYRCRHRHATPRSEHNNIRSVIVRRHERVHGGRDRTAAVVAISVASRRDRPRGVGDGRRRSIATVLDRDVNGRRQRSKCAVRRARGFGGRRRDRRQRVGYRGVSPGTPSPPSDQLLHRVAGRRGPVGRLDRHTLRRVVKRRAAPSPAPVRVLRVFNHRTVHRVHTQSSGRVRRPLLGYTLPNGLLYQLKY